LGSRQAAQSATRSRYGWIVPEWISQLPALLPGVHFTTASNTNSCRLPKSLSVQTRAAMALKSRPVYRWIDSTSTDYLPGE
jgi:hypothetical protein